MSHCGCVSPFKRFRPNTIDEPSQRQRLDYPLITEVSSDGAILPVVSLIIPTYNESENILDLIRSIKSVLDDHFSAEVIVVDDNSPDETARIVKENANSIQEQKKFQQQHYDSKNPNTQQMFSIKVVRRECKCGLVSAVLEGVKNALGQHILILDADFSHPPNVIVEILDELVNSHYDIVSASRYLQGGRIIGWPFKRRVFSKSATMLARTILGLHHITDPMSGFFAFKRDVISHITFNTSGFKLLLEILVKADNAKLKEIPYTFIDRKVGSSKLDSKVIIDFVKALLYLYASKNSKSIRDKSKRHTLSRKQEFAEDLFSLIGMRDRRRRNNS